MHFNLLLPSMIEADWDRIGGMLEPAIEYDEARQSEDVRRDLLNGDMALFDIELHEASGVVVIEFSDEVCWLLYVTGNIGGKGREWIKRVHLLMQVFEDIARRHGCTELRLEGRDWHRVFPEYERLGGRNELRKAL